jgi:hypothetical protein
LKPPLTGELGRASLTIRLAAGLDWLVRQQEQATLAAGP